MTGHPVAWRAWLASRAMVGTRYRPHGRDPAHGIDCVGLVTMAYRRAGLRFDDPATGYRLRDSGYAQLAQPLSAAGFAAVDDGRNFCGDIIIQQWRPGAFHMLIRGPASVVHAHAGLRRVVETPGAVVDATFAVWRLVRGSATIDRED